MITGDRGLASMGNGGSDFRVTGAANTTYYGDTREGGGGGGSGEGFLVSEDGWVTADVQQATAKILKFFWPGRPLPDPIDQKAADFAAQVLAFARQSSNAMNFVPRPPSAAPGLAWLMTQGGLAAVRAMSDNPGIYDSLKATVSNNWSTPYDNLLLGL